MRKSLQFLFLFYCSATADKLFKEVVTHGNLKETILFSPIMHPSPVIPSGTFRPCPLAFHPSGSPRRSPDSSTFHAPRTERSFDCSHGLVTGREFSYFHGKSVSNFLHEDRATLGHPPLLGGEGRRRCE